MTRCQSWQKNFSLFPDKHIAGISELDQENIGLLLSKNKEMLIAACKDNPEVLLDIGSDNEQAKSNVSPLAAKA